MDEWIYLYSDASVAMFGELEAVGASGDEMNFGAAA